MDKNELGNIGVDIEQYGGGFIIADYSGKTPTQFGARYCGVDLKWRNQPVVGQPFDSDADAVEAAGALFEEATT